MQADSAHAQMLIAQSHGEAASARTEAAQARAETAQARSDVAEARSEAAAAHAEAAQVSAEVAGAIAQRDAALDRAKDVAADRESMARTARSTPRPAFGQRTLSWLQVAPLQSGANVRRRRCTPCWHALP